MPASGGAGLKYLIWDFDGTLGYREGGWTGAMVEVLRQHAPDCATTADHLRPHIQDGFRWHDPHQPYAIKTADRWWGELSPIFEKAFAAVGVETSLAKRMGREVRFAYASAEQWRLYDDTLPVLTQLSRAGWTHLLLSNHVPELSKILGHLQINTFFAHIFNSAETGYEKPHLKAYQAVLEATEEAESVWMIGDSPVADIAGAAAAGIPGILVRKHHADALYQCDDLTQVNQIVERESQPKVADVSIGQRTDWR